jgi:catechol 2,3-dioxygenase-like lactoylglutathione lyase family enzyme
LGLENSMAVKRIVANIDAKDIAAAKAFYSDILDMDVVMDFGWIITFASECIAAVQISIASEGGSGTRVPDISVEVDNFEEVYEKVKVSGIQIEYGPIDEPWGVRRFFCRDPFGRLVNVISHI